MSLYRENNLYSYFDVVIITYINIHKMFWKCHNLCPIQLCYLFIYMWTYSCVFICCIYMCLWRLEILVLRHCPHSFFRQGLSLAWDLLNRLSWLASEPQGSTCPGSQCWNCKCHHLFHMCLRIKLRSSSLKKIFKVFFFFSAIWGLQDNWVERTVFLYIPCPHTHTGHQSTKSSQQIGIIFVVFCETKVTVSHLQPIVYIRITLGIYKP